MARSSGAAVRGALIASARPTQPRQVRLPRPAAAPGWGALEPDSVLPEGIAAPAHLAQRVGTPADRAGRAPASGSQVPPCEPPAPDLRLPP
ncbi:hypothetical protein ABZ719_37240 [Streptomyces sp. NPDC006743]|uniref:hypothetical protein n=1 Tax=Streptomyces sp. NPDC006743 TaxID=3154480 RepID=UPI003455429E